MQELRQEYNEVLLMNKLIIRMSSSGECPRALSAELQGYTPEPAPPWLQTSANEGKWHEQRAKDILTSEGYLVGNEQQEIKLEFPSFNLIGHIDGLIIDNKESMLLEIKSMSQFEFDRWMRGKWNEFPGYAAQVSCYMTALGLSTTLYYVVNRNSGYVDRFVLNGTPMPISTIVARLTEVSNAVIAQKLAEGKFDPTSIECRRCLFKSLCSPSETFLTPIEEKTLDKAVELYRLGKHLEREAEEQLTAAKEIFEKHLQYTKLQQYRHKNIVASYANYARSTTYPKTKLLQFFTVDQLAPAAEIREAYQLLRITDYGEEK